MDSEQLVNNFLGEDSPELHMKPEAAIAGVGPDLAAYMAHDPASQIVAEAQARLPAAQQYKLEQILQERAKLLSRFFEQQLKKQYDTMKKEVARLAKQHERDVRSLDERFKAKMAGLGKRFKALEASEAKIHLVHADNATLAGEVSRLEGIIAEKEAAAARANESMEAKQQEVSNLMVELGKAGEVAAELQRKVDAAADELRSAESAMEEQLRVLRLQLEEKRAELERSTMALHSAQAGYDDEIERKGAEVKELEASVSKLQAFTNQTKSFVGQVQEQIAKREADMRTQLQLMKNTMAFSLYIDESLAIDVTDARTTELMVRPVVVLPSGCSYSASTVEEIQAEAKANGTEPLCPQTGEVIKEVVPNVALESILARYLFKQQVTKDVLASLKEFVANSGQNDEDQPLENYIRRMKEHMAERLHHIHAEQLATAASGYEEKLGLSDLARGDAERRAAEAQEALERIRSEAMKRSAAASEEKDRLSAELAEARATAVEAQEAVESLRAARDDAVKARIEAEARVQRLENDALHDTDDIEAPATNASLAGVRKAELLKLKAELAEIKRRATAAEEQVGELRRDLLDKETDMLKVSEELSAERKRCEGLTDDNTSLREQNRILVGKNGALEEKIGVALTRANTALANAAKVSEDRDTKTAQLVEQQLTLRQVMEDLRKMRTRFDDRDAFATQTSLQLTEALTKIDELEAELSKRTHQLSVAKEAVVQEQASRGEAESGATWLATELARYKAMVDTRGAEVEDLQKQVAHAEAECNRLTKILESHGFSGADVVTLESDMEKVRATAGVYDSIGKLPKVPVLEQLATALTTAETETLGVTNRLQNMNKVERKDFTALAKLPAREEGAATRGETSHLLPPTQ